MSTLSLKLTSPFRFFSSRLFNSDIYGLLLSKAGCVGLLLYNSLLYKLKLEKISIFHLMFFDGIIKYVVDIF
ncbi:hypothetical protein DJ56_4177 [Yersinia pestis]|nr:hypothetical protein DJ56_4177 [Yersinia pestis]